MGVNVTGSQIREVHFAGNHVPRRGHGREAMPCSNRVPSFNLTRTWIHALRVAPVTGPEESIHEQGPRLPVVPAGFAGSSTQVASIIGRENMDFVALFEVRVS